VAQFRTDVSKLDNSHLITRYEVGMLSDKLTPSGTLVDAFGRMRVANPVTLFDSSHRYQDSGKWSTTNTASAFITHRSDESAVDLIVKTAVNAEVVRETYRVFTYQPGKSLMIMNTFAMHDDNSKTGVRQRVGYFNSNNGVFLEKLGANVYFVLRSKTTGTVVDTRVLQSNWNKDTFTSNSYSTQTGTNFTAGLDVTKANVMWIDLEWLGVGDVRCGFLVDGRPIPAHVFRNENVNYSAYMTTATLPLRYEIKNTIATTSNSVLKQICATVISEGGYERVSPMTVVRSTANTTVGHTLFTPIMSIRLASDRLDSVIIPAQMNFLPTSADNFEVALIKNATLTGANYDTTTYASIDVDTTATALTGGTIVRHEYVVSSVLASAPLNQGTFLYNFELQLGRTTGGVSDVLTLAARAIKNSGTGTGMGSLSFYDLTN
jgi:hypothetical protein